MKQFARAEIIRASAGAGKTYVLVQRYISLLLQGESPRSILASTFTVRAAGEIHERILRQLAEAVLDEKVRATLGKEHGLELSKSKIAQVLATTLKDFPGAAICTLDALVARIAGSLSTECDLPIAWRLSELPGLSLTLESELLTLQARELGRLLSIIVRSDGSRRIAEPLITACLRFHSRLQMYGPQAFFLGTAQKISTQPVEWIKELNLEAIPIPLTKTKTPKQNFSKALTYIKAQLKLGEPSKLLEERILQAAVEGSEFDREDLNAIEYQPLRHLADRLKIYELNRLIERSDVLLMVLAGFDKVYRAHQHATGLLKHNDLLLAVARFMSQDNLAGVAYALDQRFSHVLLDEFQDTSPLQWQILQPFVADVVNDAARARSVFVVGDPKQAIYGWRGGSAAIFDEVGETLPGAWVERTLEESYRSSATILNFVNRVFENLSLVTEEFLPTAEKFRSGFKAHKAKKDLPGRVTLTIEDGEATDWIVRKVIEIFSENREASIGILARRNETVVNVVRALRHAGLPAVGDGNAGSERSLIVESVKSLLHLSMHPADSAAQFFVAHSGLLRPGEMLSELVKISHTPAIIERLVQLIGSGELSNEAIGDTQLAIVALSDGIERGVPAGELIQMLQSQALPSGKAKVSVMTMHRAKGLEFEYVLLPEVDQKLIRSVVPEVTEWTEADGTKRVMPYVGEVLRTIDPRFASADQVMRQREAYEALCLLYVSLTRAIKELHIFGPPAEKTPFSMLGVIAESLGLDLTKSGVIFDTLSTS